MMPVSVNSRTIRRLSDVGVRVGVESRKQPYLDCKNKTNDYSGQRNILIIQVISGYKLYGVTNLIYCYSEIMQDVEYESATMKNPVRVLMRSCMSTNIMETWYVMMHTDSLQMAPTPDCLIIKFGRRMSFNSEIRIDIIYSKEGTTSEEVPFLRGEVNVGGKEPFDVDLPRSPRFPLNIMLSDFDEDKGCMAFWSCSDFGSSMVQKGGWVMCQSLDVDPEIAEKLAANLASASNMTEMDFVWTKYDSCL